jgi:hypothetical protein
MPADRADLEKNRQAQPGDKRSALKRSGKRIARSLMQGLQTRGFTD